MRPYQEQPAIPGTFGLEIEFDCENQSRLTQIIKDLNEAGLSKSVMPRIRHLGKRPEGKWIVEFDGSADGEVVSPVLTDTPEVREQVARVCQILRDNGAAVSWRNGGHTHSGARELGLMGNPEAQARLVKLARFAEDTIYRTAAGMGEDGTTHRGAYRGYVASPPLPKKVPIYSDPPTRRDQIDTVLRRLAVRVRYGMNMIALEATKHRGSTVEWRYWDPSLDPARILFHAGLGSRMVAAAVSLHDDDIPGQVHPVGEAMSGGDEATSRAAAEKFAELVYPDPGDRQAFWDVFEASAWQPGVRAKEPLQQAWTREPQREAALRPGSMIFKSVAVSAVLAAGSALLWLPTPGDSLGSGGVSPVGAIVSAALLTTTSTSALGLLPWGARFGRGAVHARRLAVACGGAVAAAGLVAIPGSLTVASDALAQAGLIGSAAITAAGTALGCAAIAARRLRLAIAERQVA